MFFLDLAAPDGPLPAVFGLSAFHAVVVEGILDQRSHTDVTDNTAKHVDGYAIGLDCPSAGWKYQPNSRKELSEWARH